MRKGPRLGIFYKTINVEDPFYKRIIPSLDKELCYANNPLSLFRKYRHLITWFANQKIGRDFLDIPQFKEQIKLLTPQGYHLEIGKGEYYALFYAKSVYSPLLYPTLFDVDLAQSFFSNTQEVKEYFLSRLGIWKPKHLHDAFGKFLFTTTTFNPNADPESTSVDGTVGYSGVGSTWNSIRTISGNIAVSSQSTDNCPFLIGSSTTGRWDELVRGIFLYDTSSLPDSAGITNATHTIDTNATVTNNFGQSLCLVDSNPASNTNLVGSDNLTLGTSLQASDIPLSAVSTNSTFVHTLNSTGKGSINKTGITKFGLRFSGDRTDTEPTWANNVEQVDISFAESGTPRPVLSVDYTTTSTSTSSSTSTSTTSTSTSTTSTSTSRTTSTSTSTSTTVSITTSTSTTSTSSSTTSTSTSKTTTSTSTTSTSTTSTSSTTTFQYSFKVKDPYY